MARTCAGARTAAAAWESIVISTELYKPVLLQVHGSDNVAIVANDSGLPAGLRLPHGITLSETIPQGHKVAVREIVPNAPIVRYGVVIAEATERIAAGSWVHGHKMRMRPAPSLLNLPVSTSRTSLPPLEGYTFRGYRNPDGSVGTRNVLAITTTVQCVAGVVEHAVRRIRSELLPRFPNVDDVVGLEHTYGCGVAIDAPGAEIPVRTLRNISLNPNFGGELMVLSLGCEKLQPPRLLKGIPIAPSTGAPATGGGEVICLQDPGYVGFEAMITSIMSSAETHLIRLNARERTIVSASELVVGVQCGGSDAFSGITANPAVGYCTDLLVRAGATVLFSEVTEVRDGVAQLTARAQSPAIAADIIRELAWYDAYLAHGGADRSANTTPGNKAGGLSNIVEKAMGSIIKSGSTPIMGVLAPGEKLSGRGLIFAATPASDFICGTLQLAAGMNLHVFTTGRGTPYNLPAVPVIKISSRTELARRWHDLIDLDAGVIASGTTKTEEVGWALFRMLLETASGERHTSAERLRLANSLVLFNPAPVT